MMIRRATIVSLDQKPVGYVEASTDDLSIAILSLESKWASLLASADLAPIRLDSDDVLRVETKQPATAKTGTDDLEHRIAVLSKNELTLQSNSDGLKAFEMVECEFNATAERVVVVPFPKRLQPTTAKPRKA